MRAAIIDLGTNTFNLLIGQATEDGFEIIYKTKEAVRLGEGGITKQHIEAAPFKRGTEALREFNEILNQYKCDRVFALATSAIRDADNGEDFINAVRKKLGIQIEVIDGQREAELIAKGVAETGVDLGAALILDIGGGSTECIICLGGEVKWMQSFQLGVTRLHEQFQFSDPITATELETFNNYISKAFQPLAEIAKQYRISQLVGASGSFTTFAKLEEDAHSDSKVDLHLPACEMNANHFTLIKKKLVKSSIAQRLENPLIPDFRAPSLHLSALLTQYLIDLIGTEGLWRSSYSLKEGKMAEWARQLNTPK